jgi:hypothetical protein
MRDELNMSQGAYNAGSINASFRVPRRTDSSTANTRKMAYFAGGVAVLLALIMGASSLTGARRSAGVPVVDPDPRPLRAKPDKAGGMAIEGGDDAILSGAKDGVTTLAPTPETPAPQALKAQALAAAQAQAAADAAASLAAAPKPVAKLAEPGPAPVAKTGPVATLAPAKPAPAPVVAAAKHASVVAGSSGTAVQLAALVTEAGAHSEWDRLSKKMPEVFAGHKPVVTKLERDGKVFWRLRTSGFTDAAQAAMFCVKAKAGGISCMVEKG